MTFWDGTRWVPELTDIHAPRSGRTLQMAALIAESALLAAIITSLLLALSPRLDAARSAAGTGTAAAAGKQTYALTYSGFVVWDDPYAFADFAVTRAKVDGTEVWVMGACFDADGAQAIPGAQPFGHVKWSSTTPLSGTARLDSVKKGSSCEVWLARSYKSTDAAPGWPETYLDVTW